MIIHQTIVLLPTVMAVNIILSANCWWNSNTQADTKYNICTFHKNGS